jgi:hypothetical protein
MIDCRLRWDRKSNIEVVRTEMSETAARARNRNPVTWFRLAVLQRTVYGDTLNRRLSTFPVAMQWREASNTYRAEERSRVFALEVLGNRRDVSNIRNLIVPITRYRRAKNQGNHTTYWENVPSTVYPLSFALEQSANQLHI